MFFLSISFLTVAKRILVQERAPHGPAPLQHPPRLPAPDVPILPLPVRKQRRQEGAPGKITQHRFGTLVRKARANHVLLEKYGIHS